MRGSRGCYAVSHRPPAAEQGTGDLWHLHDEQIHCPRCAYGPEYRMKWTLFTIAPATINLSVLNMLQLCVPVSMSMLLSLSRLYLSGTFHS